MCEIWAVSQITSDTGVMDTKGSLFSSSSYEEPYTAVQRFHTIWPFTVSHSTLLVSLCEPRGACSSGSEQSHCVYRGSHVSCSRGYCKSMRNQRGRSCRDLISTNRENCKDNTHMLHSTVLEVTSVQLHWRFFTRRFSQRILQANPDTALASFLLLKVSDWHIEPYCLIPGFPPAHP